MKIAPETWLKINWTLRDVDLSRKLRVTPERVRQMRKKLQKPRSPHFHKKIVPFAFRALPAML